MSANAIRVSQVSHNFFSIALLDLPFLHFKKQNQAYRQNSGLDRANRVVHLSLVHVRYYNYP